MFCSDERNGCGHYESDGCPDWCCEWSPFDAPSEERVVDGIHLSNGGQPFDGTPQVDGQTVVTDINLTYLATMTLDEARVMASWSRTLLLDPTEWGSAQVDRWCGECRGEWRTCGYCRAEHEAASDFLNGSGRGGGALTEGLIRYWGNDIAGELRLFRGWCPHLPFDKRLATEEREWVA